MLVRGHNSSEISIIPVSLHRVAAVAEGLKVANLVPTSFVSRRYVVHLQGALLSRDPTKFAAELGVFEDFITQGPTDVAGADDVPR